MDNKQNHHTADSTPLTYRGVGGGADNALELLPLVDPEGNILGSATRGECHDGTMRLHPVVHLHVFNGNGELYLQKRPEWKTIQPGKWDTAVGGHVDFGEDIRTALLREAREELGIDASQATLIEKYVFTSECVMELSFANRLTTDAAITPSAETDGGRFWSMEEIHGAIGQSTLTPNFEQEFIRLFGKEE